MHIKLTLQEKLRDLRDERKLKLTDVEQATGISVPTLSRFETDPYTSIAYQDLLKLAEFYDVSMDYLSGMTNHRKYRNVEIDKLYLTDEAVEVLINKKANNRLISELLAQDDFIKLLSTIEVYVDGKVSAGSNSLNASIQLTEKHIEKAFNFQDKEEILSVLREAFIDENACLRYRITERFHDVLKKLFENHKKEIDNEAETMIVDSIETCLDEYFDTNSDNEFRLLRTSLKQVGMNVSEFSHEEKLVLEKFLSKSYVTKMQMPNNRSRKHYKKRKPKG